MHEPPITQTGYAERVVSVTSLEALICKGAAGLASGPAIIDRPTAGLNIYCGAHYRAPQPNPRHGPPGRAYRPEITQ